MTLKKIEFIEQTSLPATTRFYDLDALRAVAMFLGILLHLSLIYVHMDIPFWKIQDPNKNYFFDIVLVAIHAFRLETFFLMSGFFANLLYQKRGWFYFIKNRLVRIFIPLVVSWPIVFVLFTFFQPVKNFKNTVDPTLAMSAHTTTFDNIFALSGLPPFHLWFLYYLLILYGFFLGGVLLVRIIKTDWRFLNIYFSKILPSRYFILILVSTTLPSLFSMQTLWVDIPLTFSPITRLLVYYGAFFALGCLFSQQLPFLTLLAKKRWFYFKIAVPSLLCIAPILISLGVYSRLNNILLIIIFRTLYALCTWSLVLCIIGFFHYHCNKANKIIQYLSDAAYWMYIMHLPLLIYFHKEFTDLAIAGPVKPILVLAATLTILLLSYHYMVRYSIIGALLNGTRLKPSTKATQDKQFRLTLKID